MVTQKKLLMSSLNLWGASFFMQLWGRYSCCAKNRIAQYSPMSIMSKDM
ncbi:hypothetical protein SAMN05421578_103108 [Paenibacillus macquariensis]|uniref:Uncharacterized protein n=1 Tax=Paenibacillus macquariensis TaxID=948756 RepID=A0ABY1JR04_9BACL|nr:hypothetical protein SAMN05421578_103108 [Paenibacillus macquariensis]